MLSGFKRAIMALGVVLLAVFLQGTFFRSVLEGFPVPNLLMLLVVFVAFTEPTPLGACVAFGIGLLLDLSTGVLLGPWASAFIVLFGVLASLSQHLFVDSWFATAIVAFGASVVTSGLYLVLLYQFKPTSQQLVSSLFLEGLLTAVIAGPTLALLRRIFVRTDTGVSMSRRGRSR